MATSHLMTGRYTPHFGLNSLISTLSFGEIFSYHIMKIILSNIFESIKSQGCSDGFSNILYSNLSFFQIY